MQQGARGGQTSPTSSAPARIAARPSAPSEPGAPGLQTLASGGRRDGLLYVPRGYRADRPSPLAVMLHGAGGDARGGLVPFLDLADQAELILLAPTSRRQTWDLLMGGYGPDVTVINRALRQTFARYAVDAARVAVEGFSDGASYALSVGITNGDLFRDVIAFSPGFMAPDGEVGRPRIYVSHGIHDAVLPIDLCSRRIVPELRHAGYDVTYQEFDGPHLVPPEIAREALAWFLRPR